ncbi:unnamed protein product [Onchocerca flexuosa]|uniref:Uncharacterized protein n=1 Tax=Onchocerca flexuosa TaxID=387005 RepID=A0A183HZF7_9BILA|nr:unnamed protein product [Onchocerca flexuosa]
MDIRTAPPVIIIVPQTGNFIKNFEKLDFIRNKAKNERYRNVNFLQIGSLNADTTLIGIPANFHCQEAVKLKPFAENCAEMATSDVVCISLFFLLVQAVMEADSGFVRNVRSPGSSDLVIKVNGKDVNRYDEEPEEIVGEGLFSFDEDVVPEKETGNSNEQSAVFDLFCDIQSDARLQSKHFLILPQRPPKDLYSEMRAQARSIQAVDDPERLFGERPSRRRYQTGEGRVTSQVTVPLQTFCEDATAAAAADVGEQTSY